MPQASKEKSTHGTLRSAVLHLARDFDHAAREKFLRRVDESSFPDFDDFSDEVNDLLLARRQLNTSVVIDTVLEETDRGSARFHWNQSYVDKAGVQRLKKGSCEFLFRKKGDRGWLLTSIHGDSPF